MSHSCQEECKTRADMERHHGTPAEFAGAVWNALGIISWTEAEDAIDRYNSEWAAAPEQAQ